MEQPGKVKCAAHGWQDEAFVCQHIVESLHSGMPVGFHWPSDSHQRHPDAWCTECDARRTKAGGDWSDELNEMLGIRLVCGACYDHAKRIWEKGRKETQ